MYKKTSEKYCHSPADIPTLEHFAILEFESVHIPAEGHGYSASTQNYTTYIAFTDRDEWAEEVKRRTLEKYHRPYVALRVKPANVSVSVDVRVADEE